jgi:hypothetical protein
MDYAFRTSWKPRNNKYHWINLHKNPLKVRWPKKRAEQFLREIQWKRVEYQWRQKVITGTYFKLRRPQDNQKSLKISVRAFSAQN